MKGMMFTEFLDWVEGRWSPDLVERIIAAADLPSEGAYTSVGTYGHAELLSLVTVLGENVSEDASVLVEAFGRALFPRLAITHPHLAAQWDDALDLLARLDSFIHPEVAKLYPAAEVPRFVVLEQAPGYLRLAYHSKRPFADLAAGLIAGCSDYFAANLDVVRTSGQGLATTFDIREMPKD